MLELWYAAHDKRAREVRARTLWQVMCELGERKEMFKFTPEAQARIDANRAYADEKRRAIEALTDENLVATAKLYAAHMTPQQFAPGEPVYDTTMWCIIVPEMLRRLEGRL